MYSLFVRFQDHTQRLTGTALHFSPDQFNIWLGGDGYAGLFTGYMTGITVEAGFGAYRTGDLRELVMRHVPDEVREQLDASHGKDQEGQLIATTMMSSKWTYKLEIPPEDIEENDAYTFAMWTKFSFTVPTRLF